MADITPTIFQDFTPWSGNVSPDGIWQIAGTWTGTGGNTLQPSNVSLTNTYPGESDTGFMSLTVPAGSPLRGAELQSLTNPGYSYGYYDARIETSNVHNGGVVSFFWIEQPNYGPHEWDVEFTLSDAWAGTTNPGRVSFSTHPLDNTQWLDLSFNPSQAFHDYGFLWTPGRIDFTVDEQIVRTVVDPVLNTDALGFIMMNTWSGNANFGGGPPTQNATSVYDWVKFYAGATSIPGSPPPPPPVAGSVSINDVSVSEGNNGTKVETFTLTRSGGTAAFDVDFATSDGTATIGDSDYVATSGTLHFGDGANTQTISVTVNGDTKVEANETFNVSLSNATNGATISDPQGVGTITNDDGVPANLVTNGGFETGSFSGWTIGSYQPEQTIISSNSHSGQFAAALGPAGADGSLSQNLATVVGQHYTLDFWLANMSTATDDFSAHWGSTTVMGLVNAPAQGYTEYMFDVVATNTTTHLEFDYRQDPTQWRLDDISVVAAGTPPPPPGDIVGTSGNDTLNGTSGPDTIRGLGGADHINGLGGADTLYGGTGNDTFIFSSIVDANGDKVMDFVHGSDHLDFRGIDANDTRRGDQAFTFDGYHTAPGADHHMWATEDQSTGVTHVTGDVGLTTFHVDLQGINLGLTAHDFYL